MKLSSVMTLLHAFLDDHTLGDMIWLRICL